jgi:hypothetical protein
MNPFRNINALPITLYSQPDFLPLAINVIPISIDIEPVDCIVCLTNSRDISWKPPLGSQSKMIPSPSETISSQPVPIDII